MRGHRAGSDRDARPASAHSFSAGGHAPGRAHLPLHGATFAGTGTAAPMLGLAAAGHALHLAPHKQTAAHQQQRGDGGAAARPSSALPVSASAHTRGTGASAGPSSRQHFSHVQDRSGGALAAAAAANNAAGSSTAAPFATGGSIGGGGGGANSSSSKFLFSAPFSAHQQQQHLHPGYVPPGHARSGSMLSPSPPRGTGGSGVSSATGRTFFSAAEAYDAEQQQQRQNHSHNYSHSHSHASRGSSPPASGHGGFAAIPSVLYGNSGGVGSGAPSNSTSLSASAAALAAAVATGRRHALGLSGGAAATSASALAGASSAAASAAPSPAPQQQRVVAAIREQLQQLQLSASSTHGVPPWQHKQPPSASASASPSPPSHSPLPSGSDAGSDDDISDAPLVSPPARVVPPPPSAVSARLGERMMKSNSAAVVASASSARANSSSSDLTAPTDRDASASSAPSKSRNLAGPAASISLDQMNSTLATPSPSPLSSASPPVPAPTSAALPHSSSGGSSVAKARAAAVSTAAASNRDDITIHVIDENRGVQQDFRCDRRLLACSMGYFSTLLGPASPGGGGGGGGGGGSIARNVSALAQRAHHQAHEEVDISVHCDVHIFDWLLRFVEWERDTGEYDEALGQGNQDSAAAALARGGLRPRHPVAGASRSSVPLVKPVLTLDNAVSLLISSEFLQMVSLSSESLAYVADNLDALLRSSVDLTCLGDDVLRRMIARHFADEIDGSLSGDGDDGASDERHQQENYASSPLSGLESLCALSSRDRQGKLCPRLWMLKLEAMLAARTGTGTVAPGGSDVAGKEQEKERRTATLHECAHCEQKYWSDPFHSPAAADAESTSPFSPSFCPSPQARRSVDFHGRLSSLHVARAGWSLRKWLLSLRVAPPRLGWEQIFWRAFGLVHRAPPDLLCTRCGAGGFPYADFRGCRFHEKEAVPLRLQSGSTALQITHPCCMQPAQLFGSSGTGGESARSGWGASNGCVARLHSLEPQTRRARALHQMALQHADQICPATPSALAAASPTAAARTTDPAASPTAKKRVNIVLANNTTQSFGPGPSTITPAAAAAAAAPKPAPAPSILGPAVAAALASYSPDAGRSGQPKRRRPLSERRARALRGLDPDGPSSASSGSDADADDGDDGEARGSERDDSGSSELGSDEDFEDDEDEDSDGNPTPRRRQAARPVSAADRLKFQRGYESSNPHGHASRRQNAPGSALPQRSAGVTAGAPLAQPPLVRPNSQADKALTQLRDVMSAEAFQALQEELLAAQQSAAAAAAATGAARSGPAAGSKPRAQSASIIRAGSRKPGGGSSKQTSAVTRDPPQLQSQPQPRAVKSILKAPVAAASDPQPPFAQAAIAGRPPSAAPSASLIDFSVWGEVRPVGSAAAATAAAAATGAAPRGSANRSPDGSPPRPASNSNSAHSSSVPSSSPSERRPKASYQVDYLLEDDRRRMATLVADLAHGRGTTTTTTAAAAAVHAWSGSSAGAAHSRTVVAERINSALPRRPSVLNK